MQLCAFVKLLWGIRSAIHYVIDMYMVIIMVLILLEIQIAVQGIEIITSSFYLQHKDIDRQIDRQRERERERERERQRETETDTQTDTQTHRHTDTQTDRHTDTQTGGLTDREEDGGYTKYRLQLLFRQDKNNYITSLARC